MSSNQQTNINLSLTVLSQRGENPRLHGDGWGVAFYEGDNDVRLIKDSGEAKKSQWVDFIKEQEIHSHVVIAHIRKSTVGEVSYRNTHPFTRELKGRMHTFAHNGTFKEIQKKAFTGFYKPVGSTDSEYAFCVLMDRMRSLWSDFGELPPLKDRMTVVTEFARDMRELGAANFLYSDGDTLFGHGHYRHNPITDRDEWPGLHYLHCSEDLRGLDNSSNTGISLKGEHHEVSLFASVPLSEGDWRPLKEGEVLAVTLGVRHF